jgi:glycosyltransferase involved in cell wall biosynthesis
VDVEEDGGHGGASHAGRARRLRERARRDARKRVSVVIPTKNEAENIGWVLERLPASVDEVVIVDANSTDGTVDAARRVRPDVRIVVEERPGKGAALRTGFREVRGDFVVMIDADGSMDPAEIDLCLKHLHDRRRGLGRYPIVKGSRFVDGGGTDDMELVRRLGNRVLLGLVNTFYGARFTDLCYGLFAFRRDHLDRLELEADGFEIETQIVVRALKEGMEIGEFPSFEAPRRNGESNLRTWYDGQRVLRTLVAERLSPRTGRLLRS